MILQTWPFFVVCACSLGRLRLPQGFPAPREQFLFLFPKQGFPIGSAAGVGWTQHSHEPNESNHEEEV